ncbi:MAG: class I SAM-dependent methyltransferase [Pirellulaceae bacterium]|nr:class I SAM-dependent methyltransferase [Pirellulaceae bacterium]
MGDDSSISADPLRDDGFPLASKYDPKWLIDGCYGANPLWLAEWLCRDASLRPGMNVLDLGCGRAKSSVFLARDFRVKVWAADIWNKPTDNWHRICEAGVQDDVTPLWADARDLPFPHGFFDAILAFDSFQYYGTDTLFLPYIVQFLKPAGILGFASAGLVQNFENGVPEHLSRFWTSDAWCLRTSQWWRDHWTRTGLVNVDLAETMSDGWRLWHKWATATNCSDWYLQTLERDAGQYLGYIRVIASRHPDTPHLPYDLRTGHRL